MSNSQTSAPRKRVRRILFFIGLIGTFLVAAEFWARVEGMMTSGESFIASPDLDADLKIMDGDGIKGKPGGKYMNCKLNRYGLRGPDIIKKPGSGTFRIMVLGASEAFGSPEIEGHEFPALLGDILKKRGAYEVVNVSIIGMSLRSMISYWENFASGFSPRVVLIYHNPFFYLNEIPKRSRSVQEKATPINHSLKQVDFPRPIQSRFLFRLHRTVHFPDWIQKWRDQRTIAAIRAGKPKQWVFSSVPQDKLEILKDDLEALIESVRSRGAVPVLMTHPISSDSMRDPADLIDLSHMRTNCPRANEGLFIEYSRQSNQLVRDLAKTEGLEVLDMEAQLNGQRDKFVDLVHFSNLGAQSAAFFIAEKLQPILSNASKANTP